MFLLLGSHMFYSISSGYYIDPITYLKLEDNARVHAFKTILNFFASIRI